MEDWLGEQRRQLTLHDLVDPPLGAVPQFRHHCFDRKRSERQADRPLADMVLQRFRHLQAAAAHVPNQALWPEKPRYHAKRGIMRFLRPAQNPYVPTGTLLDRLDQVSAVAGAPNRLGG